MRQFGAATAIILGALFLSGCGPRVPLVSAWQHYDACAAQTSSFLEMVDCGKQRRTAYCQSADIPPRHCGTEGEAFVQYADALAQQVRDQIITDAEAQQRFGRYKAQFFRGNRPTVATAPAGQVGAGPTNADAAPGSAPK